MRQRMFIQNQSSYINLLASSNGWQCDIGDRKWCFSIGLERQIAFNIYDSDIGKVAIMLRQQNPSITTVEIQKFIDYFIEAHPLSPTDDTLMTLAPFTEYDDEFFVLEHPFSYIIQLTHDYEEECLRIIRDNEPLKLKRLTEWFYNYRLTYGYETKFKKDRQFQDFNLAICFCQQHGVSPNNLEQCVYTDGRALVGAVCFISFLGLGVFLFFECKPRNMNFL